MAQSADKPIDDGVIRLPSVDAGMNRVAPTALRPKDQKGPVMLRPGQRRKRTEDEAEDVLHRARKRFDPCMLRKSSEARTLSW